MNVSYPTALRPQEKELLEGVTQRLEDVVGPSTGRVTATWDRTENEKQRTLYSLQLKDDTGQTQGQFTPDELRPGIPLELRLYQLWGDLLQIRNHKLLRDLQGSGE